MWHGVAAMHETCFYLMTSLHLLPSTGEFDPPPVGAMAPTGEHLCYTWFSSKPWEMWAFPFRRNRTRMTFLEGPWQERKDWGGVPQLFVPC